MVYIVYSHNQAIVESDALFAILIQLNETNDIM